MNDAWWYLSRSSGVVATVLIVAALVWGLFFAARATGTRRRPNWWLDLHTYLGGLAFTFTIIHVVSVYLDERSGIGLLQILVPMTAAGWAWGITWGVVATYVFALVVFTSWPKKLGSRRAWLTMHLLSAPAAVLAAVHAWMIGSSGHQLWFQALLTVLTGLAVYPTVLRLFAVAAKRSRQHARAATTTPPVAPGNPTATPPRERELTGSGTRR